MVRHIAVRKNCELTVGTSTHELSVGSVDDGSVYEVMTSQKRADCQKVSLNPDVREVA